MTRICPKRVFLSARDIALHRGEGCFSGSRQLRSGEVFCNPDGLVVARGGETVKVTIWDDGEVDYHISPA